MPAPTQTTGQLPNGWGVTVGVANQLALPPVQTSGGLIFYNASSSVSIAICPASMTLIASGTAPSPLVPPPSFPTAGITGPIPGVAAIGGAGSVTLLPGDKFIIDNLQATTAWNCVASGSGGALTILVF